MPRAKAAEEPAKKRVRRGSGSRATAQNRTEDEQVPVAEVLPAGPRLSKLPKEWRAKVFLAKSLLNLIERRVKIADFKGFMVGPCFHRLGWYGALRFPIEGHYEKLVRTWMSTLERKENTLVGTVRGKTYTLSPEYIQEKYKLDNHQGDEGREDLDYVVFGGVDKNIPFATALRTIYGEGDDFNVEGFHYVSDMTPLAKIIWRLVVWNVCPRNSDMTKVRNHEVYILHALLSGGPLYSLGHLIIDNIWSMYDRRDRGAIPHCFVISDMLVTGGAITAEDEFVKVREVHRKIKASSFSNLIFQNIGNMAILVDHTKRRKMEFDKRGCEDTDEYDNSVPFPSTVKMLPLNQDAQNDESPPRRLTSDRNTGGSPGGGVVGEGSPFDMMSMMDGLRGIQGQMDSGMQFMQEQFGQWQEHRGLQMEHQRLWEENEKLRSDEIQRQLEQAAIERRAMEFERQRLRHVHEFEQERLRAYYDREHHLAPMTRDSYFQNYPEELLNQQRWNESAPTAFPGVEAGRYPAPIPATRQPVREGSRFYDPDAVIDYTPSEYNPFFNDIFGPRPD